ncbi:hypothetical protein BDA96_02G362700 [Sorghum bicolor]|uniref:Uncharacterized protein n=2 Tax=Sorghum bicolor TaxID=4558 RepID=A0A921RTH8_SORBI|nr:hypothetical protein BDA96_02G362700 [Sorghum bicolor]KXG36520.1 hypothetical protein SORBI_3002G346000 [Sorghum bicolor]
MIKRKYLVASIDASREKEQPIRGRSSPISLHSSTNSPACFTTSSDSASRELRKLAGSPDASHRTHPERPVLTGLTPREGFQRVLCNVDTRLEKLLRALGEEGVLDLLLLAGACSVVVLLCAEETVDLAIGLEPDHEGSEAVVALHFTLSKAAEVGPHVHGVGAAPLEELLHRLLVTLPRGAVVVGDLVVGLASAPGGGSGGGGMGMGAIGGWTGTESGAMGGVGAWGHNFF